MKIATKLLLNPEDIEPSFSEWTIDGVIKAEIKSENYILKNIGRAKE